MAIPDYCDDRAKKHYVHSFVGSRHGDNGSMYAYRYDSTSGGKETKMIRTSRYRCVCAYCGEVGLPLQPFFKGSFNPDSDSTVTGYMCVCKDAMDQLEIEESIRQLRIKQANDMKELERTLPKPSSEVLAKVMANRIKTLTEEIESGNFTELDRLGIEVR